MSIVLKALTFSQAFFYFSSFSFAEFLLFLRLYQSPLLTPPLPLKAFVFSKFQLLAVWLFSFSSISFNLSLPLHPQAYFMSSQGLTSHSFNKYSLNKYPCLFFSLTPTFQPSNFVGSTIKIYLEADLLLLLPTRLKAPSSPGPLH